MADVPMSQLLSAAAADVLETMFFTPVMGETEVAAPPASASATGSTPSTAPAPEGGTVTNVANACAYDPAQATAALTAGKPPTRKG